MLIQIVLLLPLLVGGPVFAPIATPMAQTDALAPMDAAPQGMCEACGGTASGTGGCEEFCVAPPAIPPRGIAFSAPLVREAWIHMAAIGATRIVQPESAPPRR